MLILYNSPTSTCSQKVRMCLAEKGLDWEDRFLDNRKNEYTSPEYLKLNPNGVVPTLVHDGQVILDSSVICEYLEECFPTPPLSPAGAVGRARMRAWMRFVEEVPTPAIRVPSFHIMAPHRFSKLTDEEFDRQEAGRRPLRKHFYRKMGRHGFTEAEVQVALEELDLTLSRMEAMLAVGPWLMGEDFSIADLLVLPTLDRMDDLGLAGMWSGYPRVSDWYNRIRRRPAYARAFYPGSRLSTRFAVDRSFRLPPSAAAEDVAEDAGAFC